MDCDSTDDSLSDAISSPHALLSHHPPPLLAPPRCPCPGQDTHPADSCEKFCVGSFASTTFSREFAGDASGDWEEMTTWSSAEVMLPKPSRLFFLSLVLLLLLPSAAACCWALSGECKDDDENDEFDEDDDAPVHVADGGGAAPTACFFGSWSLDLRLRAGSWGDA